MFFPLMVLGIRCGSQNPLDLWTLCLLFFLLTVVWFVLAYTGSRAGAWLFPILLGLAALAMGHYAVLPQELWAVPREGEFRGRIYAVRTLTYDQRTLVDLDRPRARVAVHLPLTAAAAPGDELVFSGTVSQPSKAPNPGVFCYRSYLRSLGVYGVSYPTKFEVVPQSRLGLMDRVRSYLRGNLLAWVRDPSLVLALVLGDREELDTERRHTWRLLGISHLLAISGMHVGYLSLGIGIVLRRLPWRPWLKYIVVQALLLLYITVSGTGASAWRAFLASLFGGYAGLRGLRRDGLHLWAAAGWALLLCNPAFSFDLGFILSFAAAGGILLWAPVFKWKSNSRVVTYLVRSLMLSLAAQFSLVPFLLDSFGEIALLGPVATLVFLPCVAVLLIGGVLTALGLGGLGPGHVVNATMRLVEALEALLLPHARQWAPGAWSMAEVTVGWAFFLYAGWRLRQPRLIPPKRTVHQLLTVGAVLLFTASLPPVVRRPLEVTAINVGQGDCFFLQTPRGINVLIDGGGDLDLGQVSRRDIGAERVVPYLRHRRVEKLDYVILSHPHDDHLAGLLAVLEDFEVGLVLDNGDQHPSPTYDRYLDLLVEKGIPYRTLRAGDSLRLGDGVVLKVLYPQVLRPHLPSAQNNNSLLIKVEFGGVRMLFTGDLEAPVLYDLAHDPSLDLQAQWLKVPHHGSRTSLAEDFYEAVDPIWAVISADPSRFGHPHPEVLESLTRRRISWRTTADGPQSFEVWWGMWGRFRRHPS